MTEARILAQARRELDTPRPLGYVLTPAEYKRRLFLIDHEKAEARAALGLAPMQPQSFAELHGDIFQ
jgi:hypothetical protein